MLCVWVHGCDPGRVSDGLRLALYQTLYRVPFYLFLARVFCYCSFLFVVSVLFRYVLFLILICLLSLELCRCSSDLFLSSRPRTGLATTYITGYG